MTAQRRPRRHRDQIMAAVGAAALLLVAACGSAADVTGAPQPTDDTSESPTPPVRSLPPTTGTPSPTPEPAAPAMTEPKAGECRRPGTVEATLRVSDEDEAPVACKGATSVTYLVRPMTPAVKKAVTAYNTTQIVRSARPACERAAAKWLGAKQSTVKHSQFGFIVGVPPASDTALGADWMRCDLILPANTNRLTPLPAKTRNALKGKRASRYMQCVRGNIAKATGTVPCSTKHQWRGVSSVRLGKAKAKFPGRKKAQATMRDRCGTAVRSYLDTRGAFEYGYITPSKPAWQRGERWGVCFAKTRK